MDKKITIREGYLHPNPDLELHNIQKNNKAFRQDYFKNKNGLG